MTQSYCAFSSTSSSSARSTVETVCTVVGNRELMKEGEGTLKEEDFKY